MEHLSVATTLPEPSTIGLTVLVDPGQSNVDVVFVHGFTGHPVRTWSHKSDTIVRNRKDESIDDHHRPAKIPRLMSAISRPTQANDRDREPVYWPKHLLPAILPSARVLTYGYDTNVRHALGSPVSKSTVYDIAWDFLVSLEAERHSQSSRPIVFVAHSLGGIVVKEMLRRSASFQDHQIHLHKIYKSTAAIMFFGTPHGGADPRGFLQHFAEQVARACGLRVNEQVISTLLPSSERLRELRDDFGPMVQRKRWLIYSFQEEYGVQALSGKKVVEDVSSCLGDSSLETTQHIARNHMDMCRFSGLDDHEYRKVAFAFDRIRSHIEEVCQNQTAQQGEVMIPDDQQRKAFLDTLWFPTLDSRYSTIKTAHSKTCQWLLHREEYQDWFDISKLQHHHGFFWIKGKPGCGKSTLVKFAVQNVKRTRKGAKVISFFFNARGDELERSTVGMYRSLLLQLLQSYQDLQTHVSWPKFTRLQDGELYDWKIIELQTLFIDAFRKLGQRQLICFIDALDECDESQIRDLVTFLEELGEIVISSQINFQACLSSRHYPYISIRHGIELTLEGQEGHNQDITKYLDSELNAGKGKQCETIKEEIRNRASGVFLWVALVVKILNKEYDHGRVHALRRRLNEIPDGLDKLFEDILTRDQERVDQLILCLQWILYATRPLKREELYYGILSGTDAEELTLATPDAINVEDMERFILSCSKGLAETTKTKVQNVQFIHESVRDFLVGKNGFNKLKAELKPGQSHERLKQCCLEYMRIDISDCLPVGMDLPVASSDDAKNLRTRISERFPFLQYATQNLLSHADIAEQECVSQEDFLRTSIINDWIRLHNLFEKFEVRRFSFLANKIYIFTKKNYRNLLQSQFKWENRSVDSWKSNVEVYLESKSHHSLLNIALMDTKISNDTLRVILNIVFRIQNACDVRNIQLGDGKDYQQAAVEAMIKLRPINLRKNENFLTWAISKGPDAVVCCLLANGDIHCESRDWEGRPLRYSAIRRGLQAVVKLLISQSSLSVDDRDEYGQTSLFYAVNHGHGPVVSMLLSEGADPSVKDCYGRTPLSYAAENGREAVVSALLLTDVDPDAKDVLGRTPLLYAVKFGHKAVVSMLLSKVVNPDAQDDDGESPLWLVARGGEADLVSLILSKTMDPNHKARNGQTPLSIAVVNRRMAVVDTLLARPDVDVNCQDDLGRSPLWLAACPDRIEEGSEITMTKKLLTVEDIDVAAADKRGRYPLSIASAGRRWFVAALISLRSKGVSVWIISNLDEEDLIHEAIVINEQCLRDEWGHHRRHHFEVPSHSEGCCMQDRLYLKSKQKYLLKDPSWKQQVQNQTIQGMSPKEKFG